ncbi:MAG: tail fiber protein [Cyclobacteriaceae bacterium]
MERIHLLASMEDRLARQKIDLLHQINDLYTDWPSSINIGQPVLTEIFTVLEFWLFIEITVANQNIETMKTQNLSSVVGLFICLLFISKLAHAQNEQKGFSFQGYARDFSGAAYSSSNITAQFSIYPEGESVEYSEEQALTTDAYGVFSAEIGTETPVDFAAIDFSSKKYFMQVEVKVSGGDYVEISNTELLSVPYAKSADKAVLATDAISANNGNPPGVILPFAGALGNMPTGYLACDGTSVLVADYPELYAAIGDAWGGDGGTNFNLPDLRGQFMRGLDNGAGVDPDAATRTALNGGNIGDAVGSYQADTLQSHDHRQKSSGGEGANIGYVHVATQNWEYENLDTEHRTDATGATETRPVNAYVLFMIKY